MDGMTALTEQDFRVKSDAAIDQARRALMTLADQEGFEIEMQDGVLNLLFEDPSEARFVVSPNAPVRQIWVSAMARSYKLSWDAERGALCARRRDTAAASRSARAGPSAGLRATRHRPAARLDAGAWPGASPALIFRSGIRL